MDGVDSNIISQILSITVIVLMFICLLLIVVYLVLRSKDKRKKDKDNKKETVQLNETKNTKKQKSNKKKESTGYSKNSIFDFMEFDKVMDNMIVQKKGKRYLMVVECQGVNYDLMSSLEKVSVEEGFQQFLNTLRNPIQIYIQTRTVNLGKSIERYKNNLKDIESKYSRMSFEYKAMQESGEYSEQDLQKAFFELTKQRNLLEYGRDIIDNTERMSLNRNILSRKYYIVLSHYPEEAMNGDYSVDELSNIAFSELYTKSQAIIRTLSGCGVAGKILNSNELVDLLYVAYNRDDSEVFGMDRVQEAGMEELYSTAPDVFNKKVKILDQEIRNKAIDLANEKIEKVKSKKQQEAQEKETDMEKLIRNMAEIILSENQAYVGYDVAQEAIQEIENENIEEENKKGGNDNEEKQKTTRRRKSTAK